MKPGLELMPFQKEGALLLSASYRAMLVWDPGVGKTPTTVRACVKVDAIRILDLCPPIGTGVWRQHFMDWSDIRDIRIAGPDNRDQPQKFVEGEGVRIIPFSRSRADTGVMAAAAKMEWDVVILDEAHYLKSSGAQRTRAVYGEAIDLKGSPLENAEHIWCLTGTPLQNHPAEFWTHLHALAPDTIILPGSGVMTEDVFTERFCVTQATPYGVRIRGGRNTYELGQRIKPFANRKRLKDAILDMPELRIVDHPLPADTPIAQSLRLELAQAMSATGLEDTDALDDDELLGAVQAGGVAFSTVRRLIGRAKIEGVAELAEDELDDAKDAKLILFAHHREVIEGLTARLKRFSPLVITGATMLEAREIAIEMFQNDDGRRLIILAIEAAGEVITLHASHNVIIAEPSPVPAKNHQAIARAHRKGQRHPVLARFVLLPGTLDARLMSIVARKTRDIAQVVDSGGLTTRHIGEVVTYPNTV